MVSIIPQVERAAPLIPNAGYRAWSVECCRSCYAWMPDMDLRLPPARPIPYVRNAGLLPSTLPEEFLNANLRRRGVVALPVAAE